MAEEITIIIASDNHYLCHATVAMMSVLKSTENPQNIVFYFFDEGIGYSNREYLAQEISTLGGNIVFVDIDKSMFEPFFTSGHIKTSAYYRLLAPTLLPSTIKKAIYLDSDLLLLENISNLYNIDIGEATLAAVEDPVEKDNRFIDSLHKVNRRYFNSGVLVINIDNWRKENITEKLFEYVRNNEVLRYHDQDALNMIFDDKWYKLPSRWNVQTAFYKFEEYQKVCSNPALVHFTTHVKPWHIYSKHPYKDIYMQYRLETKWRDKPLLNKLLLEKLKDGSKLIIFGTGQFAKNIVENIDYEISYFIDNSSEKVGGLFFEKTIYSPAQLLLEQKDRIAIVIGSMYVAEITSQLELMGLEKEKQIFTLH